MTKAPILLKTRHTEVSFMQENEKILKIPPKKHFLIFIGFEDNIPSHTKAAPHEDDKE